MKKTLMLFSTLLMTACGGGGGGDNLPAPTPVNNAKVSGYKLHDYDDGTGRGAREVSRGAVSGNDLNTLRINGQDYQIKVPGLEVDNDLKGLLSHEDSDRTAKKNTFRQIIPGLRYSNVGVIGFSQDFDSSGDWLYTNSHLFHQGLTPNALPSGRARYEGSAYLFSYGDDDNRSLNDTKGGAHFDVDFNAKTISGRLDNKVQLNYQEIRDGFNFNGTIQGNQFSAHQDKIFYSGGFYGPNAEELGGFLRHDNDEVNGVFSGTKQ